MVAKNFIDIRKYLEAKERKKLAEVIHIEDTQRLFTEIEMLKVWVIIDFFRRFFLCCWLTF
jgi:hypothetical protein